MRSWIFLEFKSTLKKLKKLGTETKKINWNARTDSGTVDTKVNYKETYHCAKDSSYSRGIQN